MRRFRDPEALGRELCRRVGQACAHSHERYLALAVGESTLAHYAGLGAWEDALADTTILPVDELVPSPARAEAAFGVRLRCALPAGLADRFRPLLVHEDPDAEADALEHELEDRGLAACVLGLGPDGHIAMNQPGTSVRSRTRVVDLSAGNRARLGDVAPARSVLTLGIATLLRSRCAILVVAGAGKEQALDRVLHGPEGDDVPATYLRRHPAACVLIDDSPIS